MMRPRVGLTLDLDDGAARHQLPRAYADAVLAAGGLPIFLPTAAEAVDDYLALLDALVVTGGAFDVPPELYGEARRPVCGPLKPERTAFELTILKLALRHHLPVLGVCAGMQLLAVATGGALHQDLVADARLSGHEQPAPKDAPSHDVEVAAGSRLAGLVGAERLGVNSTHHQGVRSLGAGVVAVARAPDGLIEAIEVTDHPFALGVQWHPEAVRRHLPAHGAIYAGLVAAARGTR